jgi:RNA binding exosome subunit
LTDVDIANLNFRTFAQATEDVERVRQALRFASGAEEITSSTNTGYHGNPITVLEARVSDSKRIKAVFRSLGEGGMRAMLCTLEARMDDESNFFFRLDKQEAYLDRLILADGEDVIAVRAKVKSYPQSRTNAVIAMGRFLEIEIERLGKQREQD